MSERSENLSLGGREWKIYRARLGGFIKLQRKRELLYNAIESGDNAGIVGALYAFVAVIVPDLDLIEFREAPWYESYGLYAAVEAVNTIPNVGAYSILREAVGGKPVPWDNPLRSGLMWIHMIASTYGWAKAEIENLWPEIAIAFVQEILADAQAEHEFVHSLSDVSYEYNKATKKSHYKPLRRPLWMKVRRKKDVMTKLRKDMLPVGNIVWPEDADKELIH